jgi:predicted P-loop ATPase/GTPase
MQLTKGAMTTFRQLDRKAMSKASQDREWASEVSEILKLLKIAEVLPLSNSEVDRVVSTVNRVITSNRATLSVDLIGLCDDFSHESRRRY